MNTGYSVWYVSKYFSKPGASTAGQRGYYLMQRLAQLGYKVTVVTSCSKWYEDKLVKEPDYRLESVDGIQIWTARIVKYTSARSLRRVLSWIHFEWRLFWLPFNQIPEPDVVVVSSLSLLTVLNGLIWKLRFGCRLVFEVRDIWPLVLIEEGGFSAFNPFVICLKCVEWLGYRYSDAIVGTMPNLAPHVEQVLGFPKKTHCIPMGIDLSLMQKPDKLPVEYLNTYLPRGKFVVGYVGSIGVSNALDTFFQCIEAMVEKDDIHFLIVGDGYLKGKYCQKYGHLKNLTIAESVCKTAVQSILELCDLLYFSAKRCGVWKYGQSLNKLIDYMMAGKPVVASYTGFQSMINESKCGTFVNAEDLNALKLEIERYSKLDQSERLAIGKRGREWLYNNRQYSMLGDEYAKIIQEVFSKNGARIK